MIALAGVIARAFAPSPAWLDMPGTSAPPQQVMLRPEEQETRTLGDFTITPLATYTIHARVLATKRYRFDRGADLAPLDLVLGWQQMADQETAAQVDLKQRGRFVWLKRKAGSSIHVSEMLDKLANTHAIPASDAVAHSLAQLRRGDAVVLSGYLVTAVGHDGWRWSSSLRRTDTGAGACELMLVTVVCDAKQPTSGACRALHSVRPLAASAGF